jgi:DNA-binding CsgD family transcriptional regulator
MTARIPKLPRALSLSRRQLQIVALRCDAGMSRDEIGAQLFISPATIKGHWTKILFKTGLKTEQVCYQYGRGEFTREA